MMIRFLLLLLVPVLLVNGQDLRRRRPALSTRRALKGSSVISVEDKIEEAELNMYWNRKLEFSISSLPILLDVVDNDDFGVEFLARFAGKAGPGKGGLGKVGPGKAGLGKAGPGKAGHGKVGPGKAGPGKAGPGKAGPGKAGPGKAGPGKTELARSSRVGLGKSGLGKGGLKKAGPGKAGKGGVGKGGGD